MEDPWARRGTRMDFGDAWDFHGFIVLPHGYPIGNPLETHGYQMGYPREPHESPM